MINLKRKLYGVFLRVIQVIGLKLIHSKSRHIIIGCSSGTNINGNAKALFLHMQAQNTGVKSYFMTRNMTLYQQYSTKYPDATLYSYSWQALKKIVHTQAFIITHGAYDLTPFKIVNTSKPLINVWHGFPIKRLGTDSNTLSDEARKKVLGNFDGLLVMSEEERAIMSRCYHTSIDKVWVTGYPRNDFLFEKNEEIIKSLPYISGKKVLLYAPTFRDFRRTKLFPFGNFELTKLETFLEEQNSILLMRVHKNELKHHNIQESEHIKVSDGDTIQEINELLPHIDILITDYSSVYIDQLLIDKPMIFVPYDLEQFKIDRGFNFEFNEVTPGPKVSSFEDFMDQIKRYLKDPSLDSKWRTEVRNRFHKYHDNQSSERVYAKIEHLLS